MNQLIKVGNHEITTKEFKGQRVVTFKDIDLVHERVDGTAKRNFNDNKDRFIENVDYFFVKPKDVEGYEIRTAEINNFGTYLITEQGYLMLVKSFTDDLAWEVQRQLVNTYFKVNKPLSQLEILQQSVELLQEHDNRLDKLENTMNIDHGQQQVIKKLVNASVIKSLGGYESPAYKAIGKKVFSECNGDIQTYFRVNSRNNIPRVRYDEACSYIKKWEPCTNTKMLIQDYNNQLCLD